MCKQNFTSRIGQGFSNTNLCFTSQFKQIEACQVFHFNIVHVSTLTKPFNR